jgi:hypothetical protein
MSSGVNAGISKYSVARTSPKERLNLVGATGKRTTPKLIKGFQAVKQLSITCTVPTEEVLSLVD